MSSKKTFSLQEIAYFTDFLTSTLIPDLRRSGTEYTANDFEKAVAIIEQLSEELMVQHLQNQNNY
jgi:hypothetical protein